ncbi:MAG TPA: hypothetical protein VF484_08840 [Candidatus Limnocylindrales bacterium]
MAEFQWWLLLVGLVAGGGLVAVVFMDSTRREVDLADEEREAEASWISIWLRSRGRNVSADDAAEVLRAHRDYLELPPPDRLVPASSAYPSAPTPPAGPASSARRDADREADDVGHDGRGGADEDLASA